MQRRTACHFDYQYIPRSRAGGPTRVTYDTVTRHRRNVSTDKARRIAGPSSNQANSLFLSFALHGGPAQLVFVAHLRGLPIGGNRHPADADYLAIAFVED